MMLRKEEFNVLEELRKTGALPHQLEERYQKLRREQFFKAGLQADHYPPSTACLAQPDMNVTDWLRERWTSADEAVRHSLRLLAEALGITLPLIRTRHSLPKDSSPAARSESERQPSQGESDELLEDLAGLGMDPEFRRDPPQWHDELSEGWEPCESLHDALHPEDRGWY